jgi:hypothetical protein
MADVQSPSFLIGNATVMLAPQGSDVFSLMPVTHSVGMVKNVSIGVDSDTIELRSGILQSLVDSQKSNVRMNVTFEGYEFTAANLYRALGYATQTVIQRRRGTLTANAAVGATTLTIASSPMPNDPNSGITANTNIPSGTTLLIQSAATPDIVYPVRTTAAATGTGPGPFSTTITALPTGVSFSTGDTVWIVNEMAVGSTATTDFFCMKIVGTLANYNVPLVVVFPKVKITKGFSLSFSETDYSNLPFEVSPLFLSANEITGRLSEIGTTTNAKAYIGA